MSAGYIQFAPGALGLVQAFVNTNDILNGQDELRGSPERLSTWLTSHRLLASDDPVSNVDLEQALKLREALRALLRSNNGAMLTVEAIETLNYIARNSPLLVRANLDGRVELEPGVVGPPGALGCILGAVFTAMAEGTWSRLKACRNNKCQWVFYDASKNRSATWCSMAICGSRLKSHAYRQRQKGDRKKPGELS